ncbi:hypothetical protein PTSG_06669 [Salpingoeca rosetta]|uniref:Uncharacterized protein n=1 Tax=Salpingoeca rosetta (strain ATCC 50818 / BSB-021) TaxID=946362 RepID=F2UFN4_SALR5|nr:uncharacterized protein PTSG_06669 [Salpingoeca rosetta]EGD75602.1 hypothetical protein PTSG_06669 [Salpingoeca rosetta]|eukprot:XP_004992059.1 hypothetical protein PTSG_06669 [Salpingoeca rosetta]
MSFPAFGQKPGGATTTTTTASPFGQKPGGATAMGSPFGQKAATTTAATTSPFGQKPAGSPFGQKPAGSPFGQAKPGGFGSLQSQQQQQQGAAPRFALQPKKAATTGATSQAANTSATEGKDESKSQSWEDARVDNEVAAVVAGLTSHFEEMKKTRSAVQQHISNKIQGMDGIVSRLHSRLLAIASDVDRTADDTQGLKEDSLQTASDASVCERLHAADMRTYADPYSQSSSPVTEYFQRLLAKFEKQLTLYRSQTRELELAVTTTPASSAHESAQALQELLQMQAQSFVDLCAQAQHIHERVAEEAEKYKQFYKNLPKSPNDPEDPFAAPKPVAMEESAEDEESSGPQFGLPAPFNPFANPALLRQWQQQQAVMMAQYSQQPFAQQQQPQQGAFGAKPSPFGGATTGAFGAKPSPFGGQQQQGAFGAKPSPFGAATTTATTGAFGGAKPSPFGGQQQGAFGAKPSPFGGAATTANTTTGAFGAKPSPFGGQQQQQQQQGAFGAKPSPFGAPKAPGPGTATTKFGFS